MPQPKYWNLTRSEWLPLEGLTGNQSVLKRAGGSMTGTLNVTGKLQTDGGTTSKYYVGNTNSSMDADIVLENRTVSLGGSYVTNLADPSLNTDALNYKKFQDIASGFPKIQELTLSAGWKNYGGDHGVLRAFLSSDGLVTLGGIVKNTVAINSYPAPPIATLPANMRPLNRTLVACASGSFTYLARVDVKTDGVIEFHRGPPNLPADGFWLSLADVCFYIS